MDIKELEEYVTGKRTISSDKEFADVLARYNRVFYDFTDEQVRELYERFYSNEVTIDQMSFHLLFLYMLVVFFMEKGVKEPNHSKTQLLDYYNNAEICFLDEPLSLEEIDHIWTFFKGDSAIC